MGVDSASAELSARRFSPLLRLLDFCEGGSHPPPARLAQNAPYKWLTTIGIYKNLENTQYILSPNLKRHDFI